MVFSSPLFVFAFLPFVLIAYGITDRTNSMTVRNLVLFLSSLLFYAWGGIGHFALLIFLVIGNYAMGLWISSTEKKRIALTVSILFNLSVLCYFKYANFFMENANAVLQLLNVQYNLPSSKIVLPIGISFFTFQIMSYLVDVYRGKVPVQRNIIKLGLYIMLFPQLIAGPIVRYSDINREIEYRRTSKEDLERGIKRFILGFLKKIFLANSMGKVADLAFSTKSSELSVVCAWAGILCYALQIYMDFSAYSDMAIGMGWAFGFHFLENFDDPYSATSIKTFWRKWHISLSSWFRDYVYIPLGGNRKGTAKTYLNLITVFFLTGLWHGANWTFVCWGLLHGLFLLLERGKVGKIIEKTPSGIQRIYMLFVVLVAWVLFRADTITQALDYIGNMFSWRNQFSIPVSFEAVINLSTLTWFIIGILLCIPFISRKIKHTVDNHSIISTIVFPILFLLAVSFMMGDPYNPFIYFQF